MSGRNKRKHQPSGENFEKVLRASKRYYRYAEEFYISGHVPGFSSEFYVTGSDYYSRGGNPRPDTPKPRQNTRNFIFDRAKNRWEEIL